MTYIITKRSTEMYIIRERKIGYEDIINGRCNTMIVKGKCMKEGERIRFVEVDAEKQRTGREVFCEITWVVRPDKMGSKRLIKYRKVSELSAATKRKSGKMRI